MMTMVVMVGKVEMIIALIFRFYSSFASKSGRDFVFDFKGHLFTLKCFYLFFFFLKKSVSNASDTKIKYLECYL